jgi:hypothetical protein
MLSAIANVAKSAQICPKLPKTAQRQLVQETLIFHQKIEILIFFKRKNFHVVEGAPKHKHTVWIFNLRIFHMPFSMSKNGLCM